MKLRLSMRKSFSYSILQISNYVLYHKKKEKKKRKRNRVFIIKYTYFSGNKRISFFVYIWDKVENIRILFINNTEYDKYLLFFFFFIVPA